MTCKICHNNETDSTSGICDECMEQDAFDDAMNERYRFEKLTPLVK